MAPKLLDFLREAYEPRKTDVARELRHDVPIQVDDQDDYDNVSEFCNVFVAVRKRNVLRVELEGRFPLTDELRGLAQEHGGLVDPQRGRVSLLVPLAQTGLLLDLAQQIKNTSQTGDTVGNPNWHKISARTVSSLHRLARLIDEYVQQKNGRP
jgi:hypothetical protein